MRRYNKEPQESKNCESLSDYELGYEAGRREVLRESKVDNKSDVKKLADKLMKKHKISITIDDEKSFGFGTILQTTFEKDENKGIFSPTRVDINLHPAYIYNTDEMERFLTEVEDDIKDDIDSLRIIMDEQ